MSHPEEREREQFVGNILGKEVPDYARNLKTARVGKIAYDHMNGQVLYKGWRPLFIGDEDFQKYDDIMMARMNWGCDFYKGD